ncbi:MAG: hypothetical protein KC442_10585 [Thermomicrobiales bacterium]|nr:hypothetical protein [Thermomicrobiales bacterium]
MAAAADPVKARARAATGQRPRMKLPIVPWVRCGHCDKILAQRYEPWRGDPLWIQCRGCGLMNRVDECGAQVVAQQGD